jgi:phosphatidylglycerophosphatase A
MKESSDELAPAVTTTAVLVSPARRTLSDYFALAIGTCGVGFLPLAPGTWGSLVGVGLFLCVHAGSQRLVLAIGKSADLIGWQFSYESALLLLLLLPLTIGGVWAATRCESLLGRKDPRAVVIDEVIGQLLAYILVPALVPAGGKLWPFIVVGFIAFRTFDIWKPYPIRRLEKLGGGLGIVADDWLAGNYAAALMPLFGVCYRLLIY